MKKVLLCDLDGIVADLLSEWLKRYEADTGVHKTIADITQFDIHRCVPHGRKIYEYIRNAGLYSDLRPIPGAVDGLRALQEVVDVVLLSTPSRAPETAAEKIHWCKKWLPFIDRREIILAARKELVSGDFLLDDSPDHLEKWGRTWGMAQPMTIRYPYNADCRGIPPRTAFFDDWSHTEDAWAGIVAYVKERAT